MGSPTTHYSIIKPDGSDEFLTSDFDDNYDLIDAAIYAAQTRADDAYALASSGGGGGGGGVDSTLVMGWGSFAAPSVALSHTNSANTWITNKIVVPSGGCGIIAVLYVEVGQPSNVQQNYVAQVTDNGAGFGGASEFFVPEADASGTWHLPQTLTSYKASLTAGNHNIGFLVNVGTGSPSYMTLRRWSMTLIATTPGAVFT